MSDRIRVLSMAETDKVSLTKQAHALESDVNKVVSRYRQTGVWLRNGRSPMYGDFVGIEDYHACQNRVLDAEEDFLHLPAAVRRACSNDVGVFLEMLSDPERRSELLEMGLKEPSMPQSQLEPASPDPSPTSSEDV